MKAQRRPRRLVINDGPPYYVIPLTKGQEAYLEKKWLPLLGGRKNWSAAEVKEGRFYAVNNQGGRAYMHQLLGFRNGDHANGNGLDNRERNLRQATVSQQTANQRKRQTHRGVTVRSQYRGVSQTPTGRWAVLCGPAGPGRYVGTYDTEEEAALAYNRRAVSVFGKFAKLNELP